MRVELSNGQWAEIREYRLRRDRLAVREAFRVSVGEDGSREFTLSLEDRGIEALLTNMITGWSFGPPPAELVNPRDVYDELPDEDGELLAAAVRHHYNTIMGRGGDPKPQAKTISGSVSPTISSSDAAATAAPSTAPSTPNGSPTTSLPASSGGLPPSLPTYPMTGP